MQPPQSEGDRQRGDSPTSGVASTDSAAFGPAAGEGGCPPPLEWQDVLREFHSQANAWYLDRRNYCISGRTLGSGPPLYLLNGFTGTHELYALLVWLLRDQYRCVLFDYAMPATRGPVTLGDLADDLVAVGDAAGDASWTVFAPSFGGLVALEAMRRHPGRVNGAILQAAFAHRSLSQFERFLIRVCALHPGKLRHLPLRTFIQRQSHRRWFPPFDRTRWQFLADNTGAVPLADLARRAAMIRDGDLRPVLKEIKQPVLLVRAEGDGQVLEDCGHVLSAGLPRVKVEFLNDTGQYTYLTHPHRLAKLIRTFFEMPGDEPRVGT